MRRILVLGGRGFFGAAVADALRARGHDPLTPPRSELDAENPDALRARLRPDDLVIDAAGPFQRRSASLLEAAADRGADVIDLCDSVDYARAALEMRGRIDASGIRVLGSCSAVSVATAALVTRSEVAEPVRVSVCLVPASRETATRGTVASLLESVGRRVRVLRDGGLVDARGWSRSRAFWSPPELGRLRGYLTEGADAVTLPAAWPRLREVDFWVDAHLPLVNHLLRSAAWVPGAGRLARPLVPVALWFGGRFGAGAGGYVVEVEGADGRTAVRGLFAERRSFLVGVLPAVLAAEAIIEDRQPHRGIVPVDRQVELGRYLSELAAAGVRYAAGP